MSENKKYKFIISGGGTGGHIFPAISIANALKKKSPNCEILFVGATGKMEMEKVPAAGYKIIGLPVRGFQRKITFDNVTFFFKLFSSMLKAKKLIETFKPDMAIGVGGFASGPTLQAAVKKGIPTLIQEQNSYPGVTNKILAPKVKKICVAYEGMEKYFPKEKIIITGNPVRQDLFDLNNKKEKAIEYFGLDAGKKTILVVGGSLGARTINKAVFANLEKIFNSNVQLIWQTGKSFFPEAHAEAFKYKNNNIKVKDFIYKMEYAYAAADVVITRAGAGTISELCIVRKPSILVPSPNVAEDHQTKNAMALIKNNAGMMITDAEASNKLIDEAIKLVKNNERCNVFIENIAKMAVHNSADIIADEIFKQINH